MAVGRYHVSALFSDGNLFACRRDLGSSVCTLELKKVEIPNGETIMKVACGEDNIVAVMESGNVFSWYVTSVHLSN